MTRNEIPNIRDLIEENQNFRAALWLLHPDGGKYGDDGEMQANGIDYKRGMPRLLVEETTKAIQQLVREKDRRILALATQLHERRDAKSNT